MTNIKKIILAGGCFWCMAKPFYEYDGIYKVVSGYTGGHTLNPTYKDVKTGTTGHMEAILLTYDENIITLNQILDIYFSNIDPFDKDGQFIDRGENYSTAIFYNNEDEYSLALSKIKEIEKQNNKKVYVKLLKKATFYAAEEYHQNYHINYPKEYKIEFESSGRKSSVIQGKFSLNDKYYTIYILNDEILDIKECKPYKIYNNPKSILKHIEQAKKLIS